ncbi:MAG: glycosyltransferase family 39 protein, partial [Deltaproteobacteria bacterium]|nr:glycosyltransferase family 39 protein [Deltaproteobacteria bacterium]
MSRGRLLALASFVAVVLPALVLSDNLHSLAESTSFDRLMLGLRWLEPQGSRWDPNFPLGTAVLMAIPHALGLDPVAWGRGLSLLCAAGAGAVLFALVRRAAGDLAAGAAVAGMWWVPAVTRGAVVTGEEAPYLLCLLLALYGMVRGAEERAEWRWLALSVLAGNAMALVRL